MGSNKNELEKQPFDILAIRQDEAQHEVTLTKGFYMGIYTVTGEQWQAVMGNNPSFFEGGKNLPVERVSWNDCQEFIKKLREKDKRPYRLPTEAEWEHACRAGTTTPFSCGETISTDQANYNGNFTYGKGKKGVDRGKTTPVGSFPPNPWGLYDMHGNVWQWCEDRVGDYPHKAVIHSAMSESRNLITILSSAEQHGGPKAMQWRCHLITAVENNKGRPSRFVASAFTAR